MTYFQEKGYSSRENYICYICAQTSLNVLNDFTFNSPSITSNDDTKLKPWKVGVKKALVSTASETHRHKNQSNVTLRSFNDHVMDVHVISPILSSTADFTSSSSSLYTEEIFRNASAVLVTSNTSTCKIHTNTLSSRPVEIITVCSILRHKFRFFQIWVTFLNTKTCFAWTASMIILEMTWETSYVSEVHYVSMCSM